MLGRFARSGLVAARRFAPVASTQQQRLVSDEMKSHIIAANEKLCKPLSVSEARKLGDKGEIVLEDELLLDTYVEELQRAEARGQVPRTIPYEALVFFFASRGSITVANAVIASAAARAESNITATITESYIDGLVQFGDFDRAYKIFQLSQSNGEELASTAYSVLLYGAIQAGKFKEADDIIERCEDQFIPADIREKIVQ